MWHLLRLAAAPLKDAIVVILFLVFGISTTLFFGLGHVGASPDVATFGSSVVSMLRLTLGY